MQKESGILLIGRNRQLCLADHVTEKCSARRGIFYGGLNLSPPHVQGEEGFSWCLRKGRGNEERYRLKEFRKESTEGGAGEVVRGTRGGVRGVLKCHVKKGGGRKRGSFRLL